MLDLAFGLTDTYVCVAPPLRLARLQRFPRRRSSIARGANCPWPPRARCLVLYMCTHRSRAGGGRDSGAR